MRAYNRDAPYQQDNLASKYAKMSPPKDLLAWFMDWYYAETTGTPHVRGVWRDSRRRSDDPAYKPVGGSLLGSPNVGEGFRIIVDGEAFEKTVPEYEGHKEIGTVYKTPLRAALARVAGRGGPQEPGPFMSSVLYRTFQRDGDWNSACASMGINPPCIREFYVQQALLRLYERFHEEPPTNYYREQTEVA